MTVCAILQPHYLPWIGYFEMMDRVDLFIFLDDVQYVKREWKNRNRIRKTVDSTDTKWLSVPVERGSQHLAINKAQIAHEHDWISEHLNALREVYRHSPFYDRHSGWLGELTRTFAGGTLAELNIGLSRRIAEELGIRTELVLSSDLRVPGRREEKLLNICKAVGASTYLANNATAAYVAPDWFAHRGVACLTQDYVHPHYEQYSKGKALAFVPYLSVVDLLFNQGPESRSAMLSTRQKGSPQVSFALQGNGT